MKTAESTTIDSIHHQPVWKPMNSPLARRDLRIRGVRRARGAESS
jgi:hypothetical protein